MADTSPTVRDRTSDRPSPENPISPAVMAANERLAEIGEILAAGLVRLRARKSSGLLPTGADFCVGTLAQQSGPVAEIEGDSP
jgi:hypothetical protein